MRLFFYNPERSYYEKAIGAYCNTPLRILKRVQIFIPLPSRETIAIHSKGQTF
jgi:hypothetical protein